HGESEVGWTTQGPAQVSGVADVARERVPAELVRHVRDDIAEPVREHGRSETVTVVAVTEPVVVELPEPRCSQLCERHVDHRSSVPSLSRQRIMTTPPSTAIV